jgi:hypothetical protein
MHLPAKSCPVVAALGRGDGVCYGDFQTLNLVLFAPETFAAALVTEGD